MNKIEKIKELGKKLPRGARKRIAEKTGFSDSLVIRFFLGHCKLSNDSTKKILKATNEVLAEYKNESEEIDNMIDNINL